MLDFSGFRIVCLGDLMLDRFVYGEIERISPEAPVPVVRLGETRLMLGGVGNVARNIASLGGKAIVIGLLGEDQAGREVGKLLAETAGLVDGCLHTGLRPTICKTRVIATHQHVIRLDDEVSTAINPTIELEVNTALDQFLPQAHALILSDYAKGLLTPHVVRHAVAVARRFGVPIFVDPKRSDIGYYRGATVITPNLKELGAATAMPVDTDENVINAARVLLPCSEASAILVTRSDKGMTLVQADGEVDAVPAVAREVFDVSGAGDTVVAVLALAFCAGYPLPHAMRVANAAAGVVVGKLGTATLNAQELEAALAGSVEAPNGDTKIVNPAQALQIVEGWRRQGLTVGFTNGCFDILHSGHVALLRAARERCDRLVVAINTDASVSRLKGLERPINPLEDRAAVIEALQCVDLVQAFNEDTPLETIRRLQPNLLFKGADYRPEDVIGADLVRANGGRLMVLPLIPGRSTTGIIEKTRSQLEPVA